MLKKEESPETEQFTVPGDPAVGHENKDDSRAGLLLMVKVLEVQRDALAEALREAMLMLQGLPLGVSIGVCPRSWHDALRMEERIAHD